MWNSFGARYGSTGFGIGKGKLTFNCCRELRLSRKAALSRRPPKNRAIPDSHWFNHVDETPPQLH
jgi:hypothetical protein